MEGSCTDTAKVRMPPVFLHLDAGRRRVGDVQYYMDKMVPPENCILHVVSLDVVIDNIWGDAMAMPWRTSWLEAARAGYIVAFLAGPPCETWSRARFRELTDPRPFHAPRILRAAEHLWGLPSLALREIEQVLTGNCIRTFSLLMAYLMMLTGGMGVIEHPAEPKGEEKAAIWKLPAVLALLGAPGVSRHRLAQGLVAALWTKPTELLAINLPQLPLILRQWMTRCENPRRAAIGLTVDGFWRAER